VARVSGEGSNNPLDYSILQALIGWFEGGISVKIFAKCYTCCLSVAAIDILVLFSPNKSSKAICSSCFCCICKLTCSSNLSSSSNLSCFSSLGVGL
jgi:hypothetical protein